jgi:hypothetical protein
MALGPAPRAAAAGGGVSVGRFIVPLALPLLVTASTLVAVTVNRSGGREPITLSEREVYLSPRNDDNTTAAVSLSWHSPPDMVWLDRARLARLGFDTSVDPASPDAREHYTRTLPRQVFVAMELNGPAFEQVMTALDRQRRLAPGGAPDEYARTRMSRLVVVDADRDADVLAQRYPNARTHLITAATIGIWHIGPPSPAGIGTSVSGVTPPRIQVPREWAGALPLTNARETRTPPPFAIDVRYGTRYEPWITRTGAR